MRLEYENLMKSEAITSPTSKFYQKPLDYAMWKYAYYVCHKCNKVTREYNHSASASGLGTCTNRVV